MSQAGAPEQTSIPPRATAVPATAEDWTTQAADTIERVVGSIRDRTTVPLTTIARAVVYGLVAGFMGAAALLLLAIALVRLWDAYVPGRIWIGYLVIGAAFTAGGLVLWSKRSGGDE